MARKALPGRPQGADIELTLDALAMSMELLSEHWANDPHNSRRDVRDIQASIKRLEELAGRLVVHAPQHPLACSLPPAHRVTMGGTGAGRSGKGRR